MQQLICGILWLACPGIDIQPSTYSLGFLEFTDSSVKHTFADMDRLATSVTFVDDLIDRSVLEFGPVFCSPHLHFSIPVLTSLFV